MTMCFYCGEHFPHAQVLPDTQDTYVCQPCDDELGVSRVAFAAYRRQAEQDDKDLAKEREREPHRRLEAAKYWSQRRDWYK